MADPEKMKVANQYQNVKKAITRLEEEVMELYLMKMKSKRGRPLTKCPFCGRKLI